MRKLDNNELNRLSISEFKNSKKTPIIVVLDDVRSLNNIGSVFRTSDAFLIEKIYLCGITGIPPNKEINKTALGSTDTVAWEYSDNILNVIATLKENNCKVFAIEQVENAIFLDSFAVESATTYALVFGNEVFGVNQNVIEQCDGTIEIPQLGTKHSLNIAVSAGIVIWDLFSKIKKNTTRR